MYNEYKSDLHIRRLMQIQMEDIERTLGKFNDFMHVDLHLTDTTKRKHANVIRLFLSTSTDVSEDSIRAFLRQYACEVYKYNHAVKAIRVFVGRFLKEPDLIKTFQVQDEPFVPKEIVEPEDVRKFYSHIADLKLKLFFLLLATSGLRLGELCGIQVGNVDLSTHMITPNPHVGRTKQVYFSFYNEEADELLREYLAETKIISGRIFPFYNNSNVGRMFREVAAKADVKLTPKMLRDFFSEQAGDLGIQDRYVEFLTGKTKKSVLSRNYSDYAPKKMKARYDRMGLKVLSESTRETEEDVLEEKIRKVLREEKPDWTLLLRPLDNLNLGR